MNTPPRNLPRFLPTLTEVVDPADLFAEKSTAVPTLEAPILAVSQSRGEVEDALTPRVHALVNSLVAEKIHALSANLRAELAVMVKQAVHEAQISKQMSH